MNVSAIRATSIWMELLASGDKCCVLRTVRSCFRVSSNSTVRESAVPIVSLVSADAIRDDTVGKRSSGAGGNRAGTGVEACGGVLYLPGC